MYKGLYMSDKNLINPLVYDENNLAISYILTKMQFRFLRDYKHLTQEEVSLISGLSVKCIGDIESPKDGNPTLKSLMRYLDAMGYELKIQKKTI